MNINILNLKNDLINLNKLIDNYEEIYLNLYNEINNVSFLWNDANAIKFFDESNIEKNKVKNFLDEVVSIKDVYCFIIEKYEKIGNKIEFNLNQKDTLLKKFDNYINEIEIIVNLYSNLDLSFCDREQLVILNQKKDLITLKNNAQDIYNHIKITLNTIEEIEREIKLKLSRINVEFIK